MGQLNKKTNLMEYITYIYDNKEIYAWSTDLKKFTQRIVIVFYNSLDKYK